MNDDKHNAAYHGQDPYDQEKDQVTTPYPEYRPLHFDPDHHIPGHSAKSEVYTPDPDRKLGLMWTIFVTCVLATVVWLFVFFPLAVPFAVVGWIAWSVIADTRKARRLRDSNH